MNYVNMVSNKPVRILTADTLTTDYIVPLENLETLVYRYQTDGKLLPDSKMQINVEDFEQFKAAVVNTDNKKYESKSPGGSSFNTTTTLRRLLGNRISVDFMGVLGVDEDSKAISAALGDAGIHLLPLANSDRSQLIKPEAATSFAVMFPGRKRAIATYPGTAKQFLIPSMVTDELVSQSDVIFLQGSLWQKLDETFPVQNGHASVDELGFADKMMHYRWKHGNELWFALPTQSQYGSKIRTHEEKAAHFRHVMAESNVVLGNSEELARAYTTDEEYHAIKNILSQRNIFPDDLKKDDEKNSDPIGRLIEQGRLTKDEIAKFDFANHSIVAETAFARMQQAFAKEPLLLASQDDAHHGGRWTGKTDQVGFITCGKDGSVVITKNGIERLGPPKIEKNEIRNTIGAGDTAFAGFLYGYVNRRPHAISAQVATELAGAKLRHNGPTLPDPKSVLENCSFLENPTTARHTNSSRR